MMKKLHLYLIESIIICLLCNYPASALNIENIIENVQEENGTDTTGDDSCPDCSYTAFIITVAAFIIVLLPTAIGWYLYYRLRKKMATCDEERAIEDPQPETFKPKRTLWLSSNCLFNMFRRLYDRIKRKKTISDEESVIEKSQTMPTPSESKSTPRNKEKKKKKKRTKKKDSMNKSIGEAAKIQSEKQDTEDPVQVELSPQTPALPKENVCIANAIEPEQPCIVPFTDLSSEQESTKTKYKRITLLTWIDEITDDEDEEASTHQVQESQEQIPMELTSNTPEAPAKEVLPIIPKSCPEQRLACQEESPVLPQPNLRQAIEPEVKQLQEKDRDNLMDRLADRRQAIKPEVKQLQKKNRDNLMDRLADRKQAIKPEVKQLQEKDRDNLMERLADRRQDIKPEVKQLQKKDRVNLMDRLSDRRKAIKPEVKQLQEKDRDNLMDRLADRRKAIKPEVKQLQEKDRDNLMDRLADRKKAIKPEVKQLQEKDRDNLMERLTDRRQDIKPEKKWLPDLKTNADNLMARLSDCCKKSKSITSYLNKICTFKKLIHKRKRPERILLKQVKVFAPEEQKEEFQERQIMRAKPNMIYMMLRHQFKEFTDKLPVDIWRHIVKPPERKPKKEKYCRENPPEAGCTYLIGVGKNDKETLLKPEKVEEWTNCPIMWTEPIEEWTEPMEEWMDPIEEQFTYSKPSTSQRRQGPLPCTVTDDMLRKMAQDCAALFKEKQKKKEQM